MSRSTKHFRYLLVMRFLCYSAFVEVRTGFEIMTDLNSSCQWEMDSLSVLLKS